MTYRSYLPLTYLRLFSQLARSQSSSIAFVGLDRFSYQHQATDPADIPPVVVAVRPAPPVLVDRNLELHPELLFRHGTDRIIRRPARFS